MNRIYLFIYLLVIGQATGDAASAQRPVPRLARVVTVGEFEGPAAYTFGLLHAVREDRQGRVYVLDSRTTSGQLRVFDRDGRIIASAGRAGQGPGEYRAPMGLALDSRDQPHVLDPANARISVYRLAGRELQLVRAVPMPIAAYALCLLGDRIFVLGEHRGKIVHEISGDGELLRSFGEPFAPEHPMLSRITADGHIECLPSKGAVAIALQLIPRVTVYSVDGARQWTTQLRGYNPVQIQQNTNGSITYSGRDGRHDATTSLVYLPSGEFLVQFGQVSAEVKLDEIVRVQSRLLSAENGRELASTTALPRLDASGALHLLSLENQPFPRFTTYRSLGRR